MPEKALVDCLVNDCTIIQKTELRNEAYFGIREVEVMSLVLNMVNLNCGNLRWKQPVCI